MTRSLPPPAFPPEPPQKEDQMKLLAELKRCYVDYIWNGYRNARMEKILEKLGIDETLSPQEMKSP